MQALLEIKVVQVFKDFQTRQLVSGLFLRGKFGPATQRGTFQIVDPLDVHVVFPE